MRNIVNFAVDFKHFYARLPILRRCYIHMTFCCNQFFWENEFIRVPNQKNNLNRSWTERTSRNLWNIYLGRIGMQFALHVLHYCSKFTGNDRSISVESLIYEIEPVSKSSVIRKNDYVENRINDRLSSCVFSWTKSLS